MIPCKPTSPQVRVELIREDGEVINAKYDAKFGFTLEYNDTEMGVFGCRGSGSLNGTTHFFEISYQIDRRCKIFTFSTPFCIF